MFCWWLHATDWVVKVVPRQDLLLLFLFLDNSARYLGMRGGRSL